MYCMHRTFSALRANMWRPTCLPVSCGNLVRGYNIVPVSVLMEVCEIFLLSFQNCFLQGRLKPGRMLLVDTHEKVVSKDEELKLQIARSRPHSLWIKEQVGNYSLLTVLRVKCPQIWVNFFIVFVKTFTYIFYCYQWIYLHWHLLRRTQRSLCLLLSPVHILHHCRSLFLCILLLYIFLKASMVSVIECYLQFVCNGQLQRVSKLVFGVLSRLSSILTLFFFAQACCFYYLLDVCSNVWKKVQELVSRNLRLSVISWICFISYIFSNFFSFSPCFIGSDGKRNFHCMSFRVIFSFIFLWSRWKALCTASKFCV